MHILTVVGILGPFVSPALYDDIVTPLTVTVETDNTQVPFDRV